MGFGYSTRVFGELVFNTGMVGYPETLTDPSYSGQILTLTYPLVGNYGVPDPSIKDQDGIPKFFESERIQARGLVVHDLSMVASHWSMSMTLDEWMNKENIPGISGIDTRELTKKLRSSGVMMAALVVSSKEIDEEEIKKQLLSAQDYNSETFMDMVSTKEDQVFGKEKQTVVVIDTGVKNAIIRNLRNIGYKVIKVPWNTSIEKILSYKPRGVVISNGPGDPQKRGSSSGVFPGARMAGGDRRSCRLPVCLSQRSAAVCPKQRQRGYNRPGYRRADPAQRV